MESMPNEELIACMNGVGADGKGMANLQEAVILVEACMDVVMQERGP